MKALAAYLNIKNDLRTAEGRLVYYNDRHRKVKDEISNYLKVIDISSKKLTNVYASDVIGFSIYLSHAELTKMKSSPSVRIIEQDFSFKTDEITPSDESNNNRLSSGQTIGWGHRLTGTSNGINLLNSVFIIDSGVSNHPDININHILSKSFVSYTTDYSDDADTQHGTLVAGIIAAIDNDFGIKGVAAGASVISLKAMEANLRTSYSNLLSALDYVKGVGISKDVVNLSLGFRNNLINTWILKLYLKQLTRRGLFISMASGNWNNSVSSFTPANINGPNLYSTSAMDSSRTYASWSAFGGGIDYCLPGESIRTTTVDEGYGIFDGTSLGTAFLSGILLVNGGIINTDGFVLNDPDGSIDPIAVL